MSSEIQRRTERTLMFNVFAIAESVEPVINMEINICRRGSVSLLTEVMIGTAASHTASKSHCSASTRVHGARWRRGAHALGRTSASMV